MSEISIPASDALPSRTMGRETKVAILTAVVIAIITALLVALLFLLRTESAPPPVDAPPPVAKDDRPTNKPPKSGSLELPSRMPRDRIPVLVTAKPQTILASAVRDATPRRVRVVPAHPADPAAAGAPKRLANSTTWNYWLDGGNRDTVPNVKTGPLSAGDSHRLLFRLSNFDLSIAYPLVKALAGSPELLLAIREGLSDLGRASLALEVVVQSVDPERLRIADQSARIPLVIDLKAMRATLADPALQFKPGEMPDERLLAAATIAQFGIDFVPLKAGKHQIGVAMLDATTGFPLQSMIVDVSVGSSWPTSVFVHSNGQAWNVGASPPSDLSLILYDLQSTVSARNDRSLNAVLYYRNGSGGHDFLTWRTDISLPGLIQFTETFRKTVGSVEKGSELLESGYSFGRFLFAPGAPRGKACAEDRNCSDARRAREVILAAASYPIKQLPPSMVVRIISSSANGMASYASDVFPIGAMGVALDREDDAIYLGERFALALILTDQQFDSGATCPANWYVALPRAADHPPGRSSDALADALSDLGPHSQGLTGGKYVHRQSANLAELKGWLGDTSRADAEPYVLSYLGHHDVGRLFLKGNGVDAAHILRDFGDSSIAILNACNSAMSYITDGSLVGRLARQRVASTIATTSEISGHLAAAYLDCMNAVLATPAELTIGQAHARATQCLWSRKQGAGWGKRYEFKGAALKYLLIGNPHQRICAPPKEPQP